MVLGLRSVTQRKVVSLSNAAIRVTSKACNRLEIDVAATVS
jgi:hypothetical protein